jgi:hypothetical protein
MRCGSKPKSAVGVEQVLGLIAQGIGKLGNCVDVEPGWRKGTVTPPTCTDTGPVEQITYLLFLNRKCQSKHMVDRLNPQPA